MDRGSGGRGNRVGNWPDRFNGGGDRRAVVWA